MWTVVVVAVVGSVKTTKHRDSFDYVSLMIDVVDAVVVLA